MLTEDEERHQHDEVVAEIAKLEDELLQIVAGGVVSGDAAIGVTIAVGAAVGRARGRIHKAIDRDFQAAFALNASRDAKDCGVPPRQELTEAARIAREASRDAKMSLEQMLNGMRESARQGYYQTLSYARRMSNVYGHEQAMTAAVTELARNGITAYSYVTKRGVTVHVPVDVAVRRELARAGKDRQTAQTLDIAQRNGMNLIDVSICPDARESHAAWQGKRYQLKGSGQFPNFNTACHVGDMVDGYGGYNCHHEIAIARPGDKYRFQKDKDRMASLEKAGYDNKRVRELTTKQRQLENAIRKEKRVRDTLKASDLPTKDANRAIRAYQAQLRDLVGKHPQVLKRAPWRETVYDKAAKALKEDVLLQSEPLVKLAKDVNAFSVSSVVNTKKYHDAFESMPLPKSVREGAYKQAGRLLQAVDGKDIEHQIAINARTGDLVVDNLSRAGRRGKTGFTASESEKINACENDIVTIHNHPGSKSPSYRDTITASRYQKAKASVVLGHDGSVWYIECSDPSIADELERLYDELKNYLGDTAESAALRRLLDERGISKRIDFRRLR